MKAPRISVTVTCGVGSEKHNHNVEYRKNLEHIQTDEYAQVLELIPYEKSYAEQINEIMKPFIDEYNKKQTERYAQAWERFNNGEIKTKPRKANYKPMSYNYYETHKDDTIYNKKTQKNEPVKMFRSIIIGLGDKNDKDSGNISREQAEEVLKGIIKKWPFKNLKILGYTMHFEKGFWHAHLDYCCITPIDQSQQKQAQGLAVSVSQEKAFEDMGLEPEQARINQRDKVPIRFNAFRNKIYDLIENEMRMQGLRMMYNATEKKNPKKDSGKNVRMDDWQEFQDKHDQMQELKNKMYDFFDEKDPSAKEFTDFVKTADNLKELIKEIEESPKARVRNGFLVEFNLFDQVKIFMSKIFDSIIEMSARMTEMHVLTQKAVQDNTTYVSEIGRLQKEVESYKLTHVEMSRELQERKNFMQNIKDKNGNNAEERFWIDQKEKEKNKNKNTFYNNEDTNNESI